MKLTTKLGLKKPDLTDYVNISDLNDNMDMLDVAVGELKEGSTVIEELQTDNKTLSGAINEIDGRVKTHEADLASQEINKGASLVGLHDASNNFTAVNVEGAMSELFTNVSNGKDLVSGAITGVDDSVVIPTNPTFSDLGIAISSINTGKKWASGRIYSLNRNVDHIITSTLPFKPTMLVVYETQDLSCTFLTRSLGFGYTRIYHSAGNYSIASYSFKWLENGFSINQNNSSGNLYNAVHWIAFE